MLALARVSRLGLAPPCSLWGGYGFRFPDLTFPSFHPGHLPKHWEGIRARRHVAEVTIEFRCTRTAEAELAERFTDRNVSHRGFETRFLA